MKKSYQHSVLAGILLCSAILIVSLGLIRLSKTGSEQEALYLECTEDHVNGWHFETPEGNAEPVFGFGGYFLGIEAQRSGAVSACRVMEDYGERNLLEFSYFGCGLQVYLDEKLLYTDFPNENNRFDTFLKDVSTEDFSQELLHISLPADYAGKTLRIVTYGPSWDGYLSVIFPSVVSRFSDVAILTADTAKYIAAASAVCLLSLLLFFTFALSVTDKQPQWNLLPLAIYFLLSSVPLILGSYAAEASGIDPSHPFMLCISLIYMDFLILFLALEMKGFRQKALLLLLSLHLLMSFAASSFPFATSIRSVVELSGFLLFIIAVIFMFLSRKENAIFQTGIICIVSVSAVLLMFWGFYRFGNLEILYPFANPVFSLFLGDYRAFYKILCIAAAILCTIFVIIRFIQAFLEQKRKEQTLMLRTQMAHENYLHAQATIRQTGMMHHEWKNQIAALSILLQKGDYEGIKNFLNELDIKLKQLEPVHYTDHFTINTILQSIAAKAASLDVHFSASAIVPAKLDISENDLCSLLFNLLDNALEAASQVTVLDERLVECTIKMKQNYLAVKCENSYDGLLFFDAKGNLKTTKNQPDAHGFGLEQIDSIAKKYDSVLDISYTTDRFIVQTALKMK